MIVDITNEIMDRLITVLTDVNVILPDLELVVDLPCVTFGELTNTTNISTVDSDGEKHNAQSFEINIYTNGSSKMSDSKVIRNQIDEIMSGECGMNRVFSDVIPNYSDRRIYRYIMRYDCIVGEDSKIYRR